MHYRRLLTIVVLGCIAVYVSGCTTSPPAELESGDLIVTVHLEGTSHVGRKIELTLVPSPQNTSAHLGGSESYAGQHAEIVHRSNSTGRFAISDVPAGRYTLTISAQPFYADEQRVVVITGEPTSLEVELKINPMFLSSNGAGTLLFPTANGGKEPRKVIEILALLIAAESKGEIYAGQVAVGTVIVNRVSADGFPNTLADVITEKVPPHYQTYQFSPVGDLSNFSKSKVGTPEYNIALQAAYQAIAGDDPTGIDPLFFYAYKKVDPNSWIAKKAMASGYIDLGNHRFFN